MRKYALCAAATLTALVTPVFADLVSSYVVSGRNADGSSYDGKITFTPAGQVYRLDYCCVQQSGFAIEYQNFLALAEIDSGGSGNLVIYKRSGDAWAGVFSQYNDSGLGVEVLYNGSAPDLPDAGRARSGSPAGKYRISGTNPDGSTYAGEVEVTSWAHAFDVDRTIGNAETTGTAVSFDGALAMNVAKEGDRATPGVLGLFIPDGNGFLGIWAKAGGQRIGAERWVRK
jgi:hypothetical protein